jgi:hypothetical protein
MKNLSNREMNKIRGKGSPSDTTSTKKVEKVETPKDTTSTPKWYVPTDSAGGYTYTTKNEPQK